MRPIPRCAFILLVATSGPTLAADHFLTIGGGYEPQGNQVSLERNVVFFRELLAEQRSDSPPHDIFFADGNDAHRDLQYRDPNFTCSPARRIAIELFGDFDDIDIAYRNHKVPGVREGTSPSRIRDRLRDLGKQMQSDDRFLPRENNAGHLWREQFLSKSVGRLQHQARA